MAKRKKKALFSKEWVEDPSKNRAVNFVLLCDKNDPNYLHLVNLYYGLNRASNYLSKVMFRKLADEKFDRTLLRNEKFIDTLKDEFQDMLIDDHGLYYARLRRSAATLPYRFYKGYAQRGKAIKKKMPARPPSLDDKKAVFLRDQIFKDLTPEEKEFGTFRITVPGILANGKYPKIEVPYAVVGSPENKLCMSSEPSGSLKIRKGRFVFCTRAEVSYKWAYQPIGSIGFDINKAHDHFLVFSDAVEINGKSSNIFPATSEMIRLQDDIRNLMKKTKEAPTSTVRRPLRKEWKRKHDKLKAVCVPVCRAVVDHAMKHKLLVSIDDLSCGAKTGTFGQDKVVTLMHTMCENRRVPFVRCPTPYTSKICSECGGFGSTADDYDTFYCDNCDCQINRHINAAAVIADRGMAIWEDGIEAHGKWRKDIKEKIDARIKFSKKN